MKEGFRCPAVYDSNNEKYVAVTKNNQIISWTADSSSLEKFKKNLVGIAFLNHISILLIFLILDQKSYFKALLPGRCCECGVSKWSNFVSGRHN